MKALNKYIDKAFSQVIGILSSTFKCNKEDSALYLEFLEKESRIFFYSKGEEPKKINFSQVINSKMIGLGITVEKLHLALHGVKVISQKRLNAEGKRISLLLFSTSFRSMALVGVCIDGKHVISYQLSNVLAEFESKEQQLN